MSCTMRGRQLLRTLQQLPEPASSNTANQCLTRLTKNHSSLATAETTQPPVPETSKVPAAALNPFELGSKRADFKKTEATRPKFQALDPVTVSQVPDPSWRYGKGVNNTAGQSYNHILIDPYSPDRSMIDNYKLLISGIPRPISFVSTVSKDGAPNLSPFSYFQVVDHDPPIFVIGFSARATRPKDTRQNLLETGECVINVVSEHMVEAVNATSLDVPLGTSEWNLSGLQSAPSETVKPERVLDAIFSIEGKLLEMKELDYGGSHRAEGKPSGALAVIQAKRFWIREDALVGGNIDLEVMRPLVQLGGISYGRVRETFELPRPKLKEELEDASNGLKGILEKQAKIT